MGRVPTAITRAPLRTVRPRDLRGVFGNPHTTTARLVASGDLLRLAHGYVMAVPDDSRPRWLPTIETAALAIATSIFGASGACLMGLSAARVHHALPRAVSVAVVAVPRQHRSITLDIEQGGMVLFVKREVDRIDAARERLDVGSGLVTTPEQTVLDLARRPDLGGLLDSARDALATLVGTVDLPRVRQLAAEQHAPAALAAVVAAGSATTGGYR